MAPTIQGARTSPFGAMAVKPRPEPFQDVIGGRSGAHEGLSPDLRAELADTVHGHHHVGEGFASGPVIADRHAVEGVQAGLDHLHMLVIFHGPMLSVRARHGSAPLSCQARLSRLPGDDNPHSPVRRRLGSIGLVRRPPVAV